MLCKITKEEAAVLNVLADQASSLMGAGINTALAIVSTAKKPACMTTSALIHAMSDHILGLLLSHRQAHGEFLELTSLGDLKKRPDVLLALAGDLNEIFSAALRGLDPDHDYMLNLFKLEKAGTKPGSQA